MGSIFLAFSRGVRRLRSPIFIFGTSLVLLIGVLAFALTRPSPPAPQTMSYGALVSAIQTGGLDSHTSQARQRSSRMAGRPQGNRHRGKNRLSVDRHRPAHNRRNRCGHWSDVSSSAPRRRTDYRSHRHAQHCPDHGRRAPAAARRRQGGHRSGIDGRDRRHLQRCCRKHRRYRRSPGDRDVSEGAPEVRGDGSPDSEGSPAGRTSRHRQDTDGAGPGRRGWGALLMSRAEAISPAPTSVRACSGSRVSSGKPGRPGGRSSSSTRSTRWEDAGDGSTDITKTIARSISSWSSSTGLTRASGWWWWARPIVPRIWTRRCSGKDASIAV